MGRTRYCRPGQRLIPARTLLISRSGGSGDLQGAFWGRRALGSLPPGYVDRVLAPIFGGSGEAAGPPRVLDVDDGWCSWHLGAAGVMRIHLDTDLGGDPDDACALAMLLGWPGVEVVGITTTIDPGGRRAGCVAHCLQLAGRDDIGVAAGAGVSLTTLRRADCCCRRKADPGDAAGDAQGAPARRRPAAPSCRRAAWRVACPSGRGSCCRRRDG